MYKTNMTVEPFLGFKKITVSSKWSKNRQLPDFINLLFLAVFACASVYLPYSEAVSKKCQKHIHAMKTSDIVFSSPRKVKLKGPKQKKILSHIRIRENQKRTQYSEEPLLQFVGKTKTDSWNPSPYTKWSRLEPCKRVQIFSKQQDIKNRPNKKRSPYQENLIVNPNTNHGPATLRMVNNPNTQALSRTEVVNPNSLVITEEQTHPFSSDGKKGLVRSTAVSGGERTITQEQQNPLNLVKITHSESKLESNSTLLNTSIRDIQERISELYDSNQKLETELRDRDALLQEKDDLIIGIQTQLMSCEYILEIIASGNFISESSCRTQLKIEQRNEVYQLQKEWMEKELQQEKVIGSLLSALKVEKERARILQSAGSERLFFMKKHEEEWPEATYHDKKSWGKQISPKQISSDSIMPGSQKMRNKSPMLSSWHNDVQDVEMEDESINLEAVPDIDVPTTARQILGQRYLTLKSQISESSKGSEGFLGEMSDLEYLNLEYNSEIDQELGETMLKNTNTQSTHQRKRVGATGATTRKLFNLPRFFSCKKVKVGEILNRFEKTSQYQSALISHA